MRLAIITACLSLSFCAAPIAHGQSAQPGLLNPAQPSSAQPTFQFPGKDFSQSAPLWQNSNVPQTHVLVLPRVNDLHPPVKAQINRGIILHPSKSRIGDQPQGSLVAQNIYPGLRLLPIGATATLKSIPTVWPKAKLEPIPITAPNAKMLPIDTIHAAGPSPAK